MANSVDIIRTCFIYFIFSLLHTVSLLLIRIEQIKKNWPIYKCNPGIIPISDWFGIDPIDNFNECVSTMQTNYWGSLTSPLYGALDTVSGVASVLQDGISGAQENLSAASDAATSRASELGNMHTAISEGGITGLQNLKGDNTGGELQSAGQGVMGTIKHILTGTQNGLIGSILKVI